MGTSSSASAGADAAVLSLRDRLVRLRPRTLGLRARITLAFTLGALLVSALLAGTTFALARSNLLNERESNALNQAYVNANTVRNQLAAAPELDAVQQLATSLRPTADSRAFIHYQDNWFFSSPSDNESALPTALRDIVESGKPARMRFSLQGAPSFAVGLPIPLANASYYEVVQFHELNDTLRTLGLSLTGAAVLTTVAGAGIGLWAARRTLRPLVEVSHAAEAIAGGRLDTRLEFTDDPDLGILATSFNDMAHALQDRIERDARFASDVSHELRSPLMTLSAAVDILETRRDELPERSQAALDLLAVEVRRFQQLVEDLLEISRYDVGAVRLDTDELRLAEFVMQAVQASQNGAPIPVHVDAELAGAVVQADKRRLGRVVANLLDNARKYGDGATTVSLRRRDDMVQLAVEDEGPGVPAEERALIFDRFARGGLAGRRGASEGVGLGLALVAEHVRLHGGRVWVEDRHDGKSGARFVVELPLVESGS